MAHGDQTVTLNLPSDVADRVDKVRQEQGWTLDELVQAAVTRYVDDREWEDVLEYGSRKSSEQGLVREDVERLIEEYRSEAEK